MNLERPFLPPDSPFVTPQRFNQPQYVDHQMQTGGGGGRRQQMAPPPLVSRSAQNFGQRGGGRMPPGQYQQKLPNVGGFVHPRYRPAQGVPRQVQGIPGVPNQTHRNVPQMMLKDQPVEENMPGYTPQMFGDGGSSPLGASINGSMGGPISSSQSVNFDGGISTGIQHMIGGGSEASQLAGQRVIQGGSGNRGFGRVNDPRQMGGFDRNRSANFQQAKTASMTPIDFVGFNAQGEKVFDVQYYQNTPGRRDTAEFYSQYKKNPDQPTMPSNVSRMADAFMGYEGGDDGIPQGVGYAGIVGEARQGRGRQGMQMRGGPMPMSRGERQAMEGFRSAPLNQANLRNFQGRGRGRGGMMGRR